MLKDVQRGTGLPPMFTCMVESLPVSASVVGKAFGGALKLGFSKVAIYEEGADAKKAVFWRFYLYGIKTRVLYELIWSYNVLTPHWFSICVRLLVWLRVSKLSFFFLCQVWKTVFCLLLLCFSKQLSLLNDDE